MAYSDVDINLHMNNTYYPDMLWGLIPDIQEKEVTSVNLRYQKEAPLGGEITIYNIFRKNPLTMHAGVHRIRKKQKNMHF